MRAYTVQAWGPGELGWELGGQGRNNVPMKIPSNSCTTCPDSVVDLSVYLCLPLFEVVCGNLWLRQQNHPWPFCKMTLSRGVQQEHNHFSQNGYVKLYKVLTLLCWLLTNRRSRPYISLASWQAHFARRQTHLPAGKTHFASWQAHFAS